MRIGKYLPFTSLLDYNSRGVQEDIQAGKSESNINRKRGLHGLYAVAVMLPLAIWTQQAIQYSEINPVKIWNKDKQRKEAELIAVQHQKDLVNKLFGRGGLADKDKNGYISIAELEEAYRMMGINIEFVRKSYVGQDISSIGVSPVFFPPITTSDLEKAVQSFESQAAQN